MGKKAFTEKNGVFHLIEDTPDNRDKLNERITEIIQKEGNKKSIKSITYGPNKKPYRVSTNSIKDLLAKKADRVKITTVNVNRPEAEVRPGANVRPGSKAFERTDKLTKAFIKRISGIEGHTPEKLERYFSELNKEIRELHLFVGKRNKELKATGADESQLVSRGHYSRLSKSVDSPRNLWLELMVPNKAKGNRYSPNPGAMTAIGNPIKERIPGVENWTRDYVTWLDRPENGGSGILPQRGDYSPLMEQKFNLITGEQWETLSDVEKLKANNVINDLVHDQEKLNQFLPSEGAELRKWGRLSPDNAEQALEWANDAEFALDKRFNRVGQTLELVANNPVIKTGLKAVNTINKAIPTPVKLVGGTALTALDPLEAATGIHQYATSSGDDMRSKYRKGAGALKAISGLSGTTGSISAAKGGPLITAASFITSGLSGLAAWRADHLADTYQSPLEKVTESLRPEPTPVSANTEDGVAVLDKYDPYEGISSL